MACKGTKKYLCLMKKIQYKRSPIKELYFLSLDPKSNPNSILFCTNISSIALQMPRSIPKTNIFYFSIWGLSLD